VRSLAEIKLDLLQDFQKLNLESQCIMKIKEIKQKEGETIWDYDQRLKINLSPSEESNGAMTLYSPDSKVIFLVFRLIIAWLSNSQSNPSKDG
jgi:hypothetical protein